MTLTTYKGERLISRIYDMIDEKQKLQEKISPMSKDLDRDCIRALTAIQLIIRLDDEQLDKLLK